MHSVFSPIKVVKVFYGDKPDHPNPFGMAVEHCDTLRGMIELRNFIDRVRTQSGHRVAALVWECLADCLTADTPLRLRSSDDLRCVLSPARSLPETAQRDYWLRILDSRIIRF